MSKRSKKGKRRKPKERTADYEGKEKKRADHLLSRFPTQKGGKRRTMRRSAWPLNEEEGKQDRKGVPSFSK